MKRIKEAAHAPAPPQMSQLAFFVGTFDCRGEAHETPLSGAHKIKRTIASELDLDDQWLFMRFRDKATNGNPAPIRGNWQITYDPRRETFLALWTDNRGRWFSSTSIGWVGDTLIFVGESESEAGKVCARDAFTKKNDRRMTMTVDLQINGGTWTRFIDLDCRKE